MIGQLEQAILYRAIHKRADRHYLDLLAESGERDAEIRLLEAIAATQSQIVQQQVRDAIAQGDIKAAEDAIPWDHLKQRNKDALVFLFLAMMHRAAMSARTKMPAGLQDQVTYLPHATFTAMDRRAEAVANETTQASREAFRNLARRFTPATSDQAAPILTRSIFQTPRDELAVTNWAARLFQILDGAPLTANDRAMLRRSGLAARDIARIGSEGMTSEDLSGIVDGYRARLLHERVARLVQTWLMQAANEGAIDQWRQAIAAGHVQAATKTWVVMPDCCEECEAVAGQTVPLEEDFDTPAGPLSSPPLHPRCRCSVEMQETTA